MAAKAEGDHRWRRLAREGKGVRYGCGSAVVAWPEHRARREARREGTSTAGSGVMCHEWATACREAVRRSRGIRSGRWIFGRGDVEARAARASCTWNAGRLAAAGRGPGSGTPDGRRAAMSPRRAGKATGEVGSGASWAGPGARGSGPEGEGKGEGWPSRGNPHFFSLDFGTWIFVLRLDLSLEIGAKTT